jgi:hypothetical protein
VSAADPGFLSDPAAIAGARPRGPRTICSGTTGCWMAVMRLIGFVGRWACVPSEVAWPSSGWRYFASRPVVVATSRAGDSLDQEPLGGTGVIGDRIRASDAYAPGQPRNSFGPRGTTDRRPVRLPVTSAVRLQKQEGLDFQPVLRSGRRVSNPRPSAWEAGDRHLVPVDTGDCDPLNRRKCSESDEEGRRGPLPEIAIVRTVACSRFRPTRPVTCVDGHSEPQLATLHSPACGPVHSGTQSGPGTGSQ